MIPIGQIEIFMFRAEKSNLESVCIECMTTHEGTNFVLAPQITQRLRRPSNMVLPISKKFFEHQICLKNLILNWKLLLNQVGMVE